MFQEFKTLRLASLADRLEYGATVFAHFNERVDACALHTLTVDR